MQTSTISVIVPVYKAQDVLPRCIDSILAQTFHDFELLLIDDGSPDNSGEICDKYAAQDTRIRVFHQKNAGVSSARNRGMLNACGDYVTFVDSDDWLDACFLQLLLKCDADLSVIGFKGEGWDIILDYQEKTYDLKHIGLFLSEHLNDNVLVAPWCKLFRRSIIEENSISFDANLRVGEDMCFVHKYLLHIKTLSTCVGHPYHYWCGDMVKGFKYTLTADQYLYLSGALEKAYGLLSEHFHFKCQAYEKERLAMPLNNYLQTEVLRFPSLGGYKAFRAALSGHCTQHSLAGGLRICNAMISRKSYFITFLTVRLAYPVMLRLKKFIR